MVEKIKLHNGLTVVYQRLKGYKSVSIGVWVKTGSAHESMTNNGISHFIEHMVFKGTESRSASEIAMAIDGVGGEINAYTAKECTCFYTKTLKEDFDLSLELLSDMMLNPLFDPTHIETEKTVVLDEINMYEDSSEELADDLMHQVVFGDHPLSLPVLGTKSSLLGLSQESLKSYFNQQYVANNMVVSIAGDFDRMFISERMQKYFGEMKSGVLRSSQGILAPRHRWDLKFKNKDFEQVQMVLAFPGLPFDHALSYDMTLLSNLLGGSNSSLLFQEVRENLGLTYSIYSEPTFYDEIGLLEIAFGVSKDKIMEALEAICKIIRSVKANAFTSSDLQHGKNHLKGSFVLGLEGTDQYMDLIGRIELFAHKEKSMEEMLQKIEQTSIEGLRKLIDHSFGENHFAMAIVGDVQAEEAQAYYQYIAEQIK